MSRALVSLLPLFAACSEYELKPEGEVSEGLAGPEIEVYPSEVYAGTVCGELSQPVTISNVGVDDLELYEVALTGEGWTMQEGVSVFTLPPDESVTAWLVGTDGAGSLDIRSNDEDEGELSVPLDIQGDGAPTVTITSPSTGSVLDIGAASTLTATVADDVDAPEDLLLSWSSDVDGVFSTDPASADGAAAATWDASLQSEGGHALTLTAVDSCGNVGSALVDVCQNAGYTLDELDIASWHTEGGSLWDATNGWVQLTDTGGYLTGSAFAIDETVSGADVDISFSFYMGGGSGADGFTVTALDTERMSTFLGSPGCGLGYAGSSASICVSPTTDGLPGWTVEVDAYYNSEVDPTDADHVCFTFDGNLTGPAACAALPEMEDTGWHTMSVTILAPRVTVVIDDVTYIDQDLSGYFGFPAYVGFTASTGGSTNYHLIQSLEVTDYVCD